MSRNAISAARNLFGFAFLLTSTFVFGLKGMAAEMGIAVTASAIFLAFANLEKFAKFKGAGFEAELKQAVDEANATVSHLKAVTTPLITATLDILASANRWDGMDREMQNQLYDDLNKLKTSLKIEENALYKAQQRYLNIQAWDILGELIGNSTKSNDRNFGEAFIEKVGKHNFDTPPDLAKFEALLKEHNVDVSALKQYEELHTFYKKYNFP